MPNVSGYLKIKDKEYCINTNANHVSIDKDGKIMVTYAKALNTIEHPSTSSKYVITPNTDSNGKKTYNCDLFVRVDDDVNAYLGVTGQSAFSAYRAMTKAIKIIQKRFNPSGTSFF